MQAYYTGQSNPPDVNEKRNIRKVFNGIGLALLSVYLLTEIAGYIVYSLIYKLDLGYVYNNDGIRVIQPVEMLVMSCLPALCFLTIFFIYYMIKKQSIYSLFKTKNVTLEIVVKASVLCLLCQQLSSFVNIGTMELLDRFNLQVTFFDFEISDDSFTLSVDLFSSIILAPIAEELFFRGIILRNAAKISRCFAIFFSSAIFGLMHGNPYQLAGGFLMGIPLAYFTIKTGSLIPAIAAHMAVNLNASIGSITDIFNEDIYERIYLYLMIIILVTGFYVYIKMLRRGELKLPSYTDYHKKRTVPILITSWSMILIFLFYVYDIFKSVGHIPEYDNISPIVQSAIKFLTLRK